MIKSTRRVFERSELVSLTPLSSIILVLETNWSYDAPKETKYSTIPSARRCASALLYFIVPLSSVKP